MASNSDLTKTNLPVVEIHLELHPFNIYSILGINQIQSTLL
jgi:hypothetical protein